MIKTVKVFPRRATVRA